MPNNLITAERVSTLPALFAERVRQSPEKTAYRYFSSTSSQWESLNWRQMSALAARWQAALQAECLQLGDKVAVMLRNYPDWVAFDQAALGLGLVTVPLFYNDRPESAAWMLQHSGAKLLLVEGGRDLLAIAEATRAIPSLTCLISLLPLPDGVADTRLRALADWLPPVAAPFADHVTDRHTLATIVYTSGTTGRPKGVMLSHWNIVHNAFAVAQCGGFRADEVFLSFLPLSHMLERTGGYYMPLVFGAEVAYARSVQQLAEDLQAIRPTVLVSVPRIYERISMKVNDGLRAKPPIVRWLFQLAVRVGNQHFGYQQGRAAWHPALLLHPLLQALVGKKVLAAFGGRLRFAVCGGAALSKSVADLFVGLGLPLFQGYGMTECSPVVTVNRPESNIPVSIGLPIPGTEIRIGAQDELQVRSEAVMLGYWANDPATRETLLEGGWLRTGDQARIDQYGHVHIIGRLKDIIVLANGEKVPPTDIEMALVSDPLFAQVMVIGEGKPFLSALLVLDQDGLAALGLDADNLTLKNKALRRALLERLAAQMGEFPGYAQLRQLILATPWTVENGLLTPTLKMRRAAIMQQYQAEVAAIYQGHVA